MPAPCFSPTDIAIIQSYKHSELMAHLRTHRSRKRLAAAARNCQRLAAATKRASATLRSTSGAGFEFEDLISAWQLVKALSGEQAPGIGGVVTESSTVSTLGCTSTTCC